MMMQRLGCPMPVGPIMLDGDDASHHADFLAEASRCRHAAMNLPDVSLRRALLAKAWSMVTEARRFRQQTDIPPHAWRQVWIAAHMDG